MASRTVLPTKKLGSGLIKFVAVAANLPRQLASLLSGDVVLPGHAESFRSMWLNVSIYQAKTIAILRDASFNGVNLLNGDQLKLTFNEAGDSILKIQGVSFGYIGSACQI